MLFKHISLVSLYILAYVAEVKLSDTLSLKNIYLSSLKGVLSHLCAPALIFTLRHLSPFIPVENASGGGILLDLCLLSKKSI